jgi:uncharacterized protein (TIGR03435 family)
MQTIVEKQNPATNWQQMAPFLEAAMSRLSEKDRTLLALRYFENRSNEESAAMLGIGEWAARKRSERALEKLRQYFSTRGVNSTTAIIAESISAHSLQAAPAALATSVTAIAVAKGVAASASTATLIKGALKVMAWTKAKTAVVVLTGVLLAAGTTTITVRQIEEHRTYPWEISHWDPKVLDRVPPQVRIVPAKFPPGGMGMLADHRMMGIGQPLKSLFPNAYHMNWTRTWFKVQLPTGKYDFIANLPNGSDEALQREIERQFGLKTKHEEVDTNILVLTLRTPGAPGLKPAASQVLQLDENDDRFRATSCSIKYLCDFLEASFHVPVTDGTGLTQRFDIDFKWNRIDPQNEDLKRAMLEQLGLALVPTNAPVEMLIVEKR